MRNRTVGSDFSRTQRQRDTLIALFHQTLSTKSVMEIYSLLHYGLMYISTNITAGNMLLLASSIILNVPTVDVQSVPYPHGYKVGRYQSMSILTFDIADTAERLHNYLYE
ncbi:MAG: LCP family protein [Eubacteriales bacterium]